MGLLKELVTEDIQSDTERAEVKCEIVAVYFVVILSGLSERDHYNSNNTKQTHSLNFTAPYCNFVCCPSLYSFYKFLLVVRIQTKREGLFATQYCLAENIWYFHIGLALVVLGGAAGLTRILILPSGVQQSKLA